MSLIENLIIFISLRLFLCSLILTNIIILNFNNYNNKIKDLENTNKTLKNINIELENKNKELNQTYQYYIKK